MQNLRMLIFCSLILSISMIACGQPYSRNVYFFEETAAFELAKAIEREDLEKIETLVEGDISLLDVANPISGSNGLALSLHLEKYWSFSKLLELGSNANFINPYSQYSILIESCKYYNLPEPWTVDLRFVERLLSYGADPNYAVTEDFTDERGVFHYAKSPLMSASSVSKDMVKLLISSGADPYLRISAKGYTSFYSALSNRKFEIVNYYIDSVHVNVHQPMRIRTYDSLFIQDYLVNKLTLNKIRNRDAEIGLENTARWNLIEKLERAGVEFVNYNYKIK